MAEETAASSDPSMEEILASIRKIISDDKPAEEAKAEEPAEDVVELIQMVQDDGSVVDLAAAEAPAAPVAAAPVEPVAVEQPAPVAAAAPVAPPVVPPAVGALTSEPAASSAASALSSLASTLEIERLASAPAGGTQLGNGGRTLEDMVIELMRPMLKEWLDKNLPATVDRLVQKEIERISRRS